MKRVVSCIVCFLLVALSGDALAQSQNSDKQRLYNNVRSEIDSKCGAGAWDGILRTTERVDSDSSAIDFASAISDARQGIRSVGSCLIRFGFCADADDVCNDSVVELADYRLHFVQNLRFAFGHTHETDLGKAAMVEEFQFAIELCNRSDIGEDNFIFSTTRDDIDATLRLVERIVQSDAIGFPDASTLADLRRCAARTNSTHSFL